MFITFGYGQENLVQQKKVKLNLNDTLALNDVSIQLKNFKVETLNGSILDTTFYDIDFKTAKLVLKKEVSDSLRITYKKYPSFLTKKYSYYDSSKIVEENLGLKRLVLEDKRKNVLIPFDGLQTMGSITRGVTMGNNQNAVTNSSLDLQITGQLSSKVGIRASLQDTGIPIQDGGYSQKLDEFDQIFIELYSDLWSIRAGDLFLENRKTSFLNFSKKVQGLALQTQFENEDAKTEIYASGAFVRGNYAKSQFTGQEGNQGPYKLRGTNNELYVLVISGSERVFVNGILLERGEENDYVIDYNAGEVRFTPKFPITSEMRIVIEYQYSERNFSRFITYDAVTHTRKNWYVGGYLYAENDIKNQPLQQNLSAEQVEILKQAGDNPELMHGPSAYLDSYSENKILYKKITINNTEVFEYSTDQTTELYQIKFSFVGTNMGSYQLVNNQAIGKIYAYVGGNLGDFNPTTQLIAPTKLQVLNFVGGYKNTDKTSIDTEIAVSNQDLNLYSKLNDEDNKGTGIKLKASQTLFSQKNKLTAFANFDYVEKNFKTVERLYDIEFNRNWNIDGLILNTNQKLISGGLHYTLQNKGMLTYSIDHLSLGDSYTGSRHNFTALIKTNTLDVQQNFSYLKSEGTSYTSNFIRNSSQIKYNNKNNWIGTKYGLEDNIQKEFASQNLTAMSQRYHEVSAFAGKGDLDKIFTEIGYTYRVNDSLKTNILERVNYSNALYLNGRWIQTENSDLQIYANYRTLNYTDGRKKEPSLNSRIVYNAQFLNQILQTGTVVETSSGTVAQQDFTYLEVEPTQGTYMWIDYNGNGIQELQEFEIATYPDLAKYVRVYLPNQNFIRTHQNRLSENITLNFSGLQNSDKLFNKLIAKFYNQTTWLIDQKTFKDGTALNLNIFDRTEDKLAGLQTGLRNALFYNRGKQNHSVTYTWQENKNKMLLNVGSQSNQIKMHQLQYSHLIKKLWSLEFYGSTINQQTESENYSSKNYKITGYQYGPKIGYIFDQNASWHFGYMYKDVENKWNGLETLSQHKLYTSFNFSKIQKYTVNGEFSFLKNDFEGNNLTAAGYNMLESLMPGKNLTWRLLVQRNLTKYLDLNINYSGRKSESSQTIHTGSVQLRAFF